MFEPLQHLNALRAFEAVARLGSVRLASQELNVTAGAVSRQIKSLEAVLGVDVFTRAHRKLLLTKQGEELARSLSASFETISRAADRFDQSVRSSQLVIAAPGTFISRWLLPRIGLLENRIRGTHVKVVTWNRDITPSDSSVDLFVTVGAKPDLPGLATQMLAPETFGPIMTPDVWAQTATPEKLFEIRRLTTNWPPSLWRNWAQEANYTLGDAPTTRYERLIFAIQAAEAGIGPAIAPGPAVCDALKSGMLVAPLGLHVRNGAWWVSWRNDRMSGLLLSVSRWLASELQDSLGSDTTND